MDFQGNVLDGNTMKIVTRIMPRILTYEGYERMVGRGGVEAATKKKPVMTASVAWANFCETGYYNAFERLVDDDARALLSGRIQHGSVTFTL